MIESYLDILKQDEDIMLKIPYVNDYIFIRYGGKHFYYCDEDGEYEDIVPLSILFDNRLQWNNSSLCYLSEKAFNKYWKDNYIYNRGKDKYPVYDLHFFNQIHLIDFQKKLNFNYLQSFQPIKDEFKPIPKEEDGHLYIYEIGE